MLAYGLERIADYFKGKRQIVGISSGDSSSYRSSMSRRKKGAYINRRDLFSKPGLQIVSVKVQHNLN